jgi:hypothetical protein
VPETEARSGRSDAHKYADARRRAEFGQNSPEGLSAAADPEAAAALALVGRQVLAGSLVWDTLELALADLPFPGAAPVVDLAAERGKRGGR